MPFSVIGSEKDVKTSDGRVVKGRSYSWGIAEVENEDHCDFKKLRSILIRTHMLDLIHTTEEMHYEAYRAGQMETRKFGEARPRKLDNPKFKEEEEALRKRFTEQVKVEENRFRQWEQKLIQERDRLNKDLETTHAQYDTLLPYQTMQANFITESRSSRQSWRACRQVLQEAAAARRSWGLNESLLSWRYAQALSAGSHQGKVGFWQVPISSFPVLSSLCKTRKPSWLGVF